MSLLGHSRLIFRNIARSLSSNAPQTDIGIDFISEAIANHGSSVSSNITSTQSPTISSIMPGENKLPTDYKIDCSPTDHEIKHLGKIYTIPPTQVSAVFASSAKLCPTPIQKSFDVFDEVSLLVRKPSLELIHVMKHAKYDRAPVKVVLWGEQGCGKSLCLMHAMHYAAESGFLVIPITRAQNLISSEKKGTTLIKDVDEGDQFLQQPKIAATWLEEFIETESASMLLRDLLLKDKYDWGLDESSEPGMSLFELCQYGISRPRRAPKVVAALIKEIKQYASEGNIKVAVVIDGVNVFFGATPLRDPTERNKVAIEDLELMIAFKSLLDVDWRNGIILSCVRSIGNYKQSRTNITPRAQLGREGFDYMSPFIPVEIPLLSREEVTSILAYYVDKKWISPAGKVNSEKQINEVMFLTDGNPRKLQLLCDYA